MREYSIRAKNKKGSKTAKGNVKTFYWRQDDASATAGRWLAMEVCGTCCRGIWEECCARTYLQCPFGFCGRTYVQSAVCFCFFPVCQILKCGFVLELEVFSTNKVSHHEKNSILDVCRVVGPSGLCVCVCVGRGTRKSCQTYSSPSCVCVLPIRSLNFLKIFL